MVGSIVGLAASLRPVRQSAGPSDGPGRPPRAGEPSDRAISVGGRAGEPKTGDTQPAAAARPATPRGPRQSTEHRAQRDGAQRDGAQRDGAQRDGAQSTEHRGTEHRAQRDGAQRTRGQSQGTQSTEGRITEGQSTEGRSTEGRSTED